MQEIIGFNCQCGPYAFTYALLVLGIPVPIKYERRR